MKAEDDAKKALHGKPIRNSQIVESHADTPAVAQHLVAKLSQETIH